MSFLRKRRAAHLKPHSSRFEAAFASFPRKPDNQELMCSLR